MGSRLLLAGVAGLVGLAIGAAASGCADRNEPGTRLTEAAPPVSGASPVRPRDVEASSEAHEAPVAAPARRAPHQGPDPAEVRLSFEPVLGGLDNVVVITHAGDGSGRLFVVEKRGRIRVAAAGAGDTSIFLDITDRVETSNSQNDERGLLGLAFHPDFATNGRLFVNYNSRGNQGLRTVIAEFTADGDAADAASERIVLTFNQPFGNHNGGQLAFGPDGHLYIAVGDGGSANDPGGHGQNKNTLLGTMLRINVDDTEVPYVVPEDNPFVGQAGAQPEIWAFGLRNPWRATFDRETGDLYIADVGQNEIEEINFQPADSPGGENYGWNIMEGSACFRAATCDRTGLVLPVAEYRHDLGCSVTGGYVYRGAEFPALSGLYLFGDWCTRRVWGISRDDQGAWRMAEVGRPSFNIATFGEDEAGEVYVGGLGNVVRIVADAAPTPDVTPPPQESPTPSVEPPTPSLEPPTPTATSEPTEEPRFSAFVPTCLNVPSVSRNLQTAITP